MTFNLTTGFQFALPITVLYDGSAAAGKALEIAVPLIEAKDRRLTVIIVAESRAESRDLHAEAARQLESASVTADFRVLVRPTHNGLLWLVRAVGAGPVVLPCGRERLESETLCSLMDEISNPLLLVR